MTELYEYAILRVVPRAERGETLNAGVVLYCRAAGYLGARVDLDGNRLRALDPTADAEQIEALLQSIVDNCAGAGGPAGGGDIGSRFRWLTAPRSTVVRAGPVHTGLTGDPAAELDRLLVELVGPL